MENLKAVIYARYSSNSQREESIEGQIRDCTAYAERNGYMVIGAYADRAISGTTDDRPEFQKMIKDSKRKQFDLVIVWKLDHFALSHFCCADGTRTIKCNSPVDYCSIPAGRNRLLNFCPTGAEMLRDPSAAHHASFSGFLPATTTVHKSMNAAGTAVDRDSSSLSGFSSRRQHPASPQAPP